MMVVPRGNVAITVKVCWFANMQDGMKKEQLTLHMQLYFDEQILLAKILAEK